MHALVGKRRLAHARRGETTPCSMTAPVRHGTTNANGSGIGCVADVLRAQMMMRAMK